MEFTGAEIQEDIALLIEEYGNTVTLPDGSTGKAIMDSRPDVVQRMETIALLDPMDAIRAVVLYFGGGVAVGAGDLVRVTLQSGAGAIERAYRLREERPQGFLDTLAYRTFLATVAGTEG